MLNFYQGEDMIPQFKWHEFKAQSFKRSKLSCWVLSSCHLKRFLKRILQKSRNWKFSLCSGSYNVSNYLSDVGEKKNPQKFTPYAHQQVLSIRNGTAYTHACWIQWQSFVFVVHSVSQLKEVILVSETLIKPMGIVFHLTCTDEWSKLLVYPAIKQKGF